MYRALNVYVDVRLRLNYFARFIVCLFLRRCCESQPYLLCCNRIVSAMARAGPFGNEMRVCRSRRNQQHVRMVALRRIQKIPR